MARTKRGVISRAKHKKVLKAVKGQWGRRKNTIRVAKQAMEKAMQYAYRDRRNKKKEILNHYGSRGLMQVLEQRDLHIPGLSMDLTKVE